NLGVTRHDIALSTDSGTTFPISVASGLSGDVQQFVWTVPAVVTTQARIRVTAFDAAGNLGSDVSDGNFKISPGNTPDFTLSFPTSTLTVSRGQKGQLAVNIDRTGGFAGNVTVSAPDTTSFKIKLTPPSISSTGSGVSFNFKIKKKAPTGSRQLTFTGVDGNGRVRTGVLTLMVQ